MRDPSRKYLRRARLTFRLRSGMYRIIALLSAVVILAVFWNLKLTGITMAGEAFCGHAEHAHDASCGEACPLQAHIHTPDCYSDLEADLETEEIWKASIGDLRAATSTKEKVMLIAQSQLGYTESRLNFQVDANGVRHGITRYGQWYGNPYGDWSAMFAAFCLHYAGVEDVTFNAGAEAFRLEWDAAGNYRSADAYAPRVGDLLFLKSGAQPVALITTVPTETTPEETQPEETQPEETQPEETKPVSYKITKGDGATWRKNSGKDLSFTADGSRKDFTAILVDGKKVNSAYYTVAEDSAVVTLNSKLLQTLELGKHTVKLQFTDGEASGTFTVAVAVDDSNPKTGDEFALHGWTALLFVSLTGIIGTAFACRKKFSK